MEDIFWKKISSWDIFWNSDGDSYFKLNVFENFQEFRFIQLRVSFEICAQTFKRPYDTNTTFILLFVQQSKIYS